MKYLAIDIETTGLDPHKHQILQLGAVYTDSMGNIIDTFEQCIRYNTIHGEPFALSLNHRLIENMKDAHPLPNVIDEFSRFIYNNFAFENKITIAGKNFRGFDYEFLLSHDFIEDGGLMRCSMRSLSIHHRIIDVGSMYLEADDDVIPDLKECLKRAKIDKEVAHTALSDCIDIVKLITYRLQKLQPYDFEEQT